jgi:hypothetical protein
LILLARRGPLGLFNFPGKPYWLAPQRRSVVRRMLATNLGLVMGATLAFLVLIPIWTVLGARDPGNAVAPVVFWVPVVCFALALFAWVLSVRRRYRPDPDDAAG